MFRCQYCRSHVSLNDNDQTWIDLMGTNLCWYFDKLRTTNKMVHAPYQNAAFYAQGTQDELVIRIGEIPIIRYGYLRFWLASKQIALRTSESLIKAGIYHDEQLAFHKQNGTFEELEVPEFIVLGHKNKNSFQTLDEAIKWAFHLKKLDGATFQV